ncbi:MAG: LacI family DNA-binding transcriptional regulator [Armatimonadaceae bacterium]
MSQVSAEKRTRVSRERGVTLADIAKKVGVSKVTVSYVLNGRDSGIRISEKTRNQVLDVARELGYYPNALARGLTRQRMDTFTLVMQSPSVFRGGSGFINAMMHGVVEAANAVGFDVMLHTKAQPDTYAEMCSLTDGRADGSLLLRDREDPLLAALIRRGHPCVSIFSRPEAPEAWCVDCDNIHGGQLATEYLLSLGHRRIGYIGGSRYSSAVEDRRAGYHAALAAVGLTPNPDWEASVTFAGGDFGAVIEMMKRPAGERPTAFFVWSDDVAAQMIRVLRQHCGLQTPEDVSVIGFDGTEAVGEWGSFPRLTSVGQPIQEIASSGVRLLIARIQEESVAETRCLLTPTLVVRDSCANPA